MIDKKDHEQIGIIQLLQDMKLLDSVSIVAPYSHDIVQEFYANLKYDINDINSLDYHRVYVHGDMYEFSPLLMGSFLNCPTVKCNKVKELKLGLDMDLVAIELTGSVEIMWPASNTLIITVFSLDLDDHKTNRVTTDLFCMGVIGHLGCVFLN